jgi:hypothetical protein
MVPMFPELLPYLREVFEEAEEGTEFVITRYRRPAVNLRTQLLRIIERAGLKAWPKLWQNLRSTRETELAESYPLHVVCAWIGNSEPVAAKHYLQVISGPGGKGTRRQIFEKVRKVGDVRCTRRGRGRGRREPSCVAG